ncbi:hypothetical protein NEMBOFW57_009076 [Staphylotrichum longicolle]|uniref:Heterokaryon incompatibility domain-containing protein n=1 Tax=Staphylotrichum longicolle TaxID=669026 RepID=A0AAD4ET85_9PEZI|nr:hypothetical protein NEMBOFW57_009076 [Staphylotrichum longicolle]
MAEDVDTSSRGFVIVMPAIADQADEPEHPEHTSHPAFQNADSGLLYPLVRYGDLITTRYPYRKLRNGQIRLLKLFPKSFVKTLLQSRPDTGTGRDITVETLHGDLIDVNIADSDKLAYTCLSYAWGTEAQTTPIWIQDYRVGITPTLSRALRCLMRQDEPRLVWVDFICINQDDLVERKEQVELMYQIYHGAEDVCVYLGDEEDGSENVAVLLTDILRAMRSKSELGTTVLSVQKDLLPPRESHVWRCLRKVLERPWFTRVWVVQEAIAGKELMVICGRWGMSGRSFFLAVEAGVDQELPFMPTTDDGNSWTAPIASSLRQIMLMGQLGIYFARNERVEQAMPAWRRDWSLLDLLERSRHAKSTDPRDRVFAFLNLCRERGEKSLGPDYTETVAETYLRVAKFFVEKGGEAVSRLLCNALLSESTLILPSWVPDWSLSNLPFENIAPEPYQGEIQMPSAGGTEGDFNLEGSYNGLRLSTKV